MTIKMPRVVIESPYAGNVDENLKYARLCAVDCLRRGEAPYASHLITTQFLDDNNSEERKVGMSVGFAWGEVCDYVVVYTDLGISNGMIQGTEVAAKNGKQIFLRKLPLDLIRKLVDSKECPECFEDMRAGECPDCGMTDAVTEKLQIFERGASKELNDVLQFLERFDDSDYERRLIRFAIDRLRNFEHRQKISSVDCLSAEFESNEAKG